MLTKQMKKNMDPEMKVASGVTIAAVILVLFLILNPFVIVNPGERGVVLNMGAVSGDIMNEGFNWRTPIVQQVKKMNVKTIKVETETMAYSKDTQTVDSKMAVTYHLSPDKVNTIYQTIGNNSTVEGTIIQPFIQEVFKSVVAKYTAGELLEKREQVSSSIKDGLSAKLIDKDVNIESVSILNFDFSDAYENAVEQKQVAAQDALKAENKLKQVQFEADQRVAQAKAEAEAIKIQAEAITQQGGADYVKLKAIERWNGILPTQMIPNATVPFIDLNK